MKTKRQPTPGKKAPVQAGVSKKTPHLWIWALVVLGSFAAVYAVYAPALHGPFTFDDYYLPFFQERSASDVPIMGVRPLLHLTFWLNRRISDLQPYSYHLFNVILHWVNGLLVALIAARLLSWAGLLQARERLVGAGFAAAVFLLHPLQTEAVSYVAGRSETLSVLFAFAAFAWFLYRRRDGIGWWDAAAVVVLFAAAVMTKEHTMALLGVLVLTDLYWRRGSAVEQVKSNWRLYVPIAAAGTVGLMFVLRVLGASESAGFGYKEFTWQQYLYTQFRVIWEYLRLFLLPTGQNFDYQYRISASLLEPGTVAALMGLLAVTCAAFFYRRKYRLSSYGWFLFLILLSPTSSFVPIADAMAERRMYLPMIGLLLIVADLMSRWKSRTPLRPAAVVAVIFMLALLSYQRNHLYGNPVDLWADAVSKNPANVRARFQLAHAYFEANRCAESIHEYTRLAGMQPPDHRVLVNWALALECGGDPQGALDKLQKATETNPTGHVYSQLGRLYGILGRDAEAQQVLEKALQVDPGFDMTYVYLGHLRARVRQYGEAANFYRTALRLNPSNETARQSLQVMEEALRSAPGK
jgi:protein O-mannosyl-transferase